MDLSDDLVPRALRMAQGNHPLIANLYEGPAARWLRDELTYWLTRATERPTSAERRRALEVVAVIPFLLLQKPGRGGEKGRISRVLQTRIEMWKNGLVDELLRDATKVAEKRQHERLVKGASEGSDKEFGKRVIDLVRAGEIRKATSLCHEDNDATGPAPLTPAVKEKLLLLHPSSSEPPEDFDTPPPDRATVESVTAEGIRRAATQLRGAPGPSGLTTDVIRLLVGGSGKVDSSRPLQASPRG